MIKPTGVITNEAPTPKGKNNMAKNKKQRNRTAGPIISTKDVLVAYYRGGQGKGGCKAIQKLMNRTDEKGNQSQLARRVGWEAVDELTSNDDVESLEAFVEKHCGPRPGSGTKGKRAPEAGENRSYKTQHPEKASPFVSIPVGLLGDPARVSVSFEEGRITLTPGKGA
jgi:hypothetical protein